MSRKDTGSRFRKQPPARFGGAIRADMALDVVGANTGKLYIEADILALDPYKVTARTVRRRAGATCTVTWAMTRKTSKT